MLFIHGEKDSYLPVEQSRKLYALAAQPKTLWVAPGARHNQAVVVHPEKYAKLALAFFNTHLADTPGEHPRSSVEPATPAAAQSPPEIAQRTH
jgi:hypothetical protein